MLEDAPAERSVRPILPPYPSTPAFLHFNSSSPIPPSSLQMSAHPRPIPSPPLSAPRNNPCAGCHTPSTFTPRRIPLPSRSWFCPAPEERPVPQSTKTPCPLWGPCDTHATQADGPQGAWSPPTLPCSIDDEEQHTKPSASGTVTTFAQHGTANMQGSCTGPRQCLIRWRHWQSRLRVEAWPFGCVHPRTTRAGVSDVSGVAQFILRSRRLRLVQPCVRGRGPSTCPQGGCLLVQALWLTRMCGRSRRSCRR